MNIFKALIASHDTQRSLSAQLRDSLGNDTERARIFEELKLELQAHETAEERCFYVPLFEHDDTVDASRHAIAEHHEMDEMVESLEKMDPHSREWTDCIHKLLDKIEHHLKEEEGKFFQQAGEVLTEAQKESLGRDYVAEHASMREKVEQAEE
ncbi:hemerythrin domain-containing protein [Ramlibacter sp.]|uniref:hemerythrin domain-containing protein n=1 Tax=Ramlibacter sp. TaxID=1917967 RepID=UPI003D12762D